MKNMPSLFRIPGQLLVPLLAASLFCAADTTDTDMDLPPAPETLRSSSDTTDTTEATDADMDRPPAPETPQPASDTTVATEAADAPEKPEKKPLGIRKKPKKKKVVEEPKPVDPGWIGDCYYYAEGGYYHQDGVYWRPDMKTHYVYAEGCWHLANDGILTAEGVYYPPMAAPDGLFGIPWRLAAVMTALIAGPPQDPGKPPEPPARETEPTEARSSSDR